MCGRYYVDEEMAREVERLIRILDGRMRIPHAGDVYPSRRAAVIRAENKSLAPDEMTWGFPGFGKKGLLINARAETALTKPTYRESVEKRRCVIPARGFYEWNSAKEKFTFRSREHEPLFIAGCYNWFGEEEQFVILTTGANASMRPVHDRMPLILKSGEVEPWLTDASVTREILGKTPEELERSTEYEQIKLF